MSGRLVLAAADETHVGLVRKLNEDGHVSRPDIGLFVVADGMGGHGGGDVASGAVVAALRALPPPESASAFLADFEARILAVNRDLREQAVRRSQTLIGTTLAALLIHDSHFACVWCGDSRIYLSRAGRLTRLTRDHSEVQDLIDRGVLDEAEARTWPRRNVITRALGVADVPELEIVDGPALPGDRYLLCSDGLTGHVGDAEILARLSAPEAAGAAQALIDLTLKRGAKDNVTVVIVDCYDAEKTIRFNAAAP